MGHVTRTREMRKVRKMLVGQPELIKPLGRHRHKWEDDIKMDVKEMYFEGVGSIQMAEDKDHL